MNKPEAPNKTKNAPTTGHSWDGIEEYNNPLPRWWVWVFLLTIVFAIGYVAYYPALPGGKPTVSGWTSVGQLDSAQKVAAAGQGAYEAKIAGTDLAGIEQDPELRTYATAAGKALFANNCSQCHGAGGAGAKGYPNLLDDEWVHGGSLSAIFTTIAHGVRAAYDPETRQAAAMPAFGKDELLTHEQISDAVNYLSVLAYKYAPNDSTKRGEAVFAENCALCHGAGGEGNREMGAPPLNNAIWMFGGSNEVRTETLMNGRAGVMPAWASKLSEADMKKLAVYVYGLGGGEAEAVSATAAPAAAPVSGAVVVSETVAAAAVSATAE